MISENLLALALCVSQISATNTISINIDPEPIVEVSTQAIDGESSLYGFNIDRDIFDIYRSTSDIKVSYNSVYCGTVRVNVGGAKMKNKLSSGDYAYGVLIRATMSPKEFDLTNNGTTYSYRGRSRYLSIIGSTKSTEKLIDTQPGNVARSSSYSIGISVGIDSSGANGSISASTTITQNALDIINTSNVIDGDINIKYQYNRHFWPRDWERTKYCWYDSVQRCSFFFSSPSSVSSKSLIFRPTFAIDDGQVWIRNKEAGYEIQATSIITAKFPE